jgi:hypothetical protein
MRFFPSILPGNAIQYPVKRRRNQRVIENVTPGGGLYQAVDAGRSWWYWELAYQDIGSQQRQALDGLFDECKGRLLPFVFLDPFENLVSYSEDFSQPAWGKEANIVAVGSQLDPFGSNRAFRLSNASGAAGSILQQVYIPSWVPYTVSCWLRANGSAAVEILAHPSGSTTGQSVALGPAWERYAISVSHSGNEEELLAGLRLPANTEVYAFGFQLEQFSSLSEYKRTNEESGVHANSRFGQDEIRWVTNGIDHHSARIAIESPILS